MNLPKLTVTVILLIFTVESQCGVIDNIFGRVKNTTNALRQDVRNVWSYSKSVVGIETPVDSRPEEEKRGLIGGMVHSTREKLHNFRNYFWNTDVDATDSGLFGNMYNRVKNKLSKVTHAILGEDQTPRPPSHSEKLIQQTLDKLFFGNGTRQIHGKAFQAAVEKLKKKLQEIKDKLNEEKITPVSHGEGLIDIRALPVNMEDNIRDNTPGVNNDIYDAVKDNLIKARDETVTSYINIKKEGDKIVTSLSNGVDNAADQLNVMRDKTFDTAARENELLQSYNHISAGAQKVSSGVKNAAEEAKRLAY